MQELANVPKVDKWMQNHLTYNDTECWVNMALPLFCYSKTTAWLDSIIACDEKWILNDSMVWKLQWVDCSKVMKAVSKPGLCCQKLMLYTWYLVYGIMFELLPSGTTTFYFEHVQWVNNRLGTSWWRHGKVHYLHNNDVHLHIAR